MKIREIVKEILNEMKEKRPELKRLGQEPIITASPKSSVPSRKDKLDRMKNPSFADKIKKVVGLVEEENIEEEQQIDEGFWDSLENKVTKAFYGDESVRPKKTKKKSSPKPKKPKEEKPEEPVAAAAPEPVKAPEAPEPAKTKKEKSPPVSAAELEPEKPGVFSRAVGGITSFFRDRQKKFEDVERTKDSIARRIEPSRPGYNEEREMILEFVKIQKKLNELKLLRGIKEKDLIDVFEKYFTAEDALLIRVLNYGDVILERTRDHDYKSLDQEEFLRAAREQLTPEIFRTVEDLLEASKKISRRKGQFRGETNLTEEAEQSPDQLLNNVLTRMENFDKMLAPYKNNVEEAMKNITKGPGDIGIDRYEQEQNKYQKEEEYLERLKSDALLHGQLLMDNFSDFQKFMDFVWWNDNVSEKLRRMVEINFDPENYDSSKEQELYKEFQAKFQDKNFKMSSLGEVLYKIYETYVETYDWNKLISYLNDY